MSEDAGEFWSAIPEKALHPIRVSLIEALWWIDEPLASVELVDVFDGLLSMWEAEHHLSVLETFDVVVIAPDRVGAKLEARPDRFGVRYRLKSREGRNVSNE